MPLYWAIALAKLLPTFRKWRGQILQYVSNHLKRVHLTQREQIVIDKTSVSSRQSRIEDKLNRHSVPLGICGPLYKSQHRDHQTARICDQNWPRNALKNPWSRNSTVDWGHNHWNKSLFYQNTRLDRLSIFWEIVQSRQTAHSSMK